MQRLYEIMPDDAHFNRAFYHKSVEMLAPASVS